MAPFARTTLPAHLNPEHRGRGQPTLYRPEYAVMVAEDMAKGFTLAAFAGLIGVARDTVYEWVKRHPDFSDAVNRGKAGQQRAYERKLLTADRGGEVAAAIFGLKNIAPQDWREVRTVKHDHDHAIHMLTDAQLNAIASQRATGDGNTIDAEFWHSESSAKP